MEWFDKENLKLAYAYTKDDDEAASMPMGPLWYPSVKAIDALGEKFFISLETLIRSDQYEPDCADVIFIPKDNFGIRPAALITMTDKIIYQAIFNPKFLGEKIDNQLRDCCYANRLLGTTSYFKDWSRQWNAYIDAAIRAFKRGFIYYIELDVRSYYPSIVIKKLEYILKSDFGVNEKILKVLTDQLIRWDNSNLSLGIPQSPGPSRILGNVYLHPLDVYLSQEQKNEFHYGRYADDIIIMAKSEDILLKTVDRINNFLFRYHLELNEKTKKIKLSDSKYLINKKYSSDYDDSSFLSSLKRVGEIEPEIPSILRKIKRGSPKKEELSRLKYYLKANYDGKYSKELLRSIPLIPSFTHLIVKYIISFGDDIFALAKEILDQCRKNDWIIFWLIKFICLFKEGKHNQDIVSIINRIKYDNNYHYAVKLTPLYYSASRGNLPLENDYIKNAIDNANFPIEKVNYLFLSQYLKLDMAEHIKSGLKSQSVDEQIMSLYLSKIKPVSIDDAEKSAFSLIYCNQWSPRQVTTKEAMPIAEIVDWQFKELTQISRQSRKKKRSTNKIIITHSGNKGLCRKYKKQEVCYPIRGKKRLSLITALLETKKIPGTELMNTIGYNGRSLLTKEIGEINNNLKKDLYLKEDLIVRAPTGGYYIPQERFEVIKEKITSA